MDRHDQLIDALINTIDCSLPNLLITKKWKLKPFMVLRQRLVKSFVIVRFYYIIKMRDAVIVNHQLFPY